MANPTGEWDANQGHVWSGAASAGTTGAVLIPIVVGVPPEVPNAREAWNLTLFNE